MLNSLPLAALLRIVDYFGLEEIPSIGGVNSAFYQAIHDYWSPDSIHLGFNFRQKIRRHLFAREDAIAYPAHFTHIFLHNNSLLQKCLGRVNRVKSLVHEQSPKYLKSHHPYYYRQLPLAVTPKWPLPPPIVEPDQIPLPLDTSLVDLMFLLFLNAGSLENVDLHLFDTSPLKWDALPANICPRDIIATCCHPASENPRSSSWYLQWQLNQPKTLRHPKCWETAGAKILDELLARADPSLASQLRCGLSGGIGPTFTNLKSLSFNGWGLAHLLTVLRAFGVRQFPALESLELAGTMVVTPALTELRDVDPRPRIHPSGCDPFHCPVGLLDLGTKLTQILSFNTAPYTRWAFLMQPVETVYDLSFVSKDKQLESFWMGPFNGLLWQPEGFPKLKRLALRVGNFDDASRWITPMVENCFAYAPELETLCLDHIIVNPPMNPDSPLFRLLSIARERPRGGQAPFGSLLRLQLRTVESASELWRLQDHISRYFRRPIILQTRKLMLRIASNRTIAEEDLLRNWVSNQFDRIKQQLSVFDVPTRLRAKYSTLGPEDVGPFSDPDAAMLIISFDPHDPEREGQGPLGTHWEGRTIEELVEKPLIYGDQVSKIMLKHVTPSDPDHKAILLGTRFSAPMLVSDKKVLDELNEISIPHLETISTSDSDFTPVPERSRPLRRITVQLDLPQLWQVTEFEGKRAVEAEIEALREIILLHPDFRTCEEIRLVSCARITYGGANWVWWERGWWGRESSAGAPGRVIK